MSRTCSSTSYTRLPHSMQYHWNFSSVPSGLIRSTTSPTDPASGRCGECGTRAGSSHIWPSRMCTVSGPLSETTLTCMVPRTW